MTAADAFLHLLGIHLPASGRPREQAPPTTIPDPDTGRPLTVASVDVSDRCVCPRCTTSGRGAYVSFVADLRLAFACPACAELVWISGA